VPSLWFLFRATLDGRLDKDGGPLGVPEPETGVAKNAGEGDER